MTGASSRPEVLAARSSMRVAAIAEKPWALPVVVTCVGWVSWVGISTAGGHGHIHHLLVTSAMTVAMMGPLAIPVCVAAARSSLWTGGARSVVVALATFLVVWIAAGGVLHVLTELAITAAPVGVVAVGLAVWCAVDVASRRRSRRLSACVVSRPLFPHSPALGAVGLGGASASRCLATCWAPMGLAVAYPAFVIPVSAAILLERLITPRPLWSLTVAFGLMAAWALVVTWS